MKRKHFVFGLAFLLIGLMFGFFISAKLDIMPSAQSQVTKQPIAAEMPVSRAGTNMEDAIINVAGTSGKAVVSISSEHTEKIKGIQFGPGPGGSQFGNDENLRRFFGDFFNSVPEREFKQSGLGSGVIISPEGYILTNAHVVGEADKITVTLSDGREFKAEVKGVDRRSDLAVIKINARNLTVPVLGDSDNLKIGQWVVAIGNPFGFAMQNPEPTVTVGVISALHRSLKAGVMHSGDYNDLIQTDAAINPGNSGGPLVNLKGEIIGINVAIVSTSGGYQGMGFAIPINNAKRILSNLIEGKKVAYGWLGITVQDLNDDLAKYFGLIDKNGALIAKINDDAPAQKAGMKEKDIIKQVDGVAVNNVRELINVVGKIQPGRKVKIDAMRDKKMIAFDVLIGERPQEIDEQGNAVAGAQEAMQAKWRGLTVEGITLEVAQRFRTREKSGVIVTQVEPKSPAEDAGIMPGIVILEINKIQINNMADYNKTVKDLKGDCLIRTQAGFVLIKDSGK